jgi:hypothetical protein
LDFPATDRAAGSLPSASGCQKVDHGRRGSPPAAVAHGVKLTTKQRTALFHGEHPRIVYPGARPCPVGSGDVLQLSSRVSLTVIAVRRTKHGEWLVSYTVRDDRPNMLRARLPADPTPFKGDLDQEAEQIAALESAYTSNYRDSLPGAGDAPTHSELKELTIDAHKRWAEHQEQERAEETALNDARRVARQLRELAVKAARAGADPTAVLAGFERQIRERLDELEHDR